MNIFLKVLVIFLFTIPYNLQAQNFSEIIKVVASDGAISDAFGVKVSISGDYAIVGASGDDENGKIDAGSAYIFKKDNGGTDNWGQIKKITASDGAADDHFGINVSISGDYAIVGAWADDDNGNNSGSAYIFKKDNGGVDNWGQIKKIIASDAAGGDNFGYRLSMSGNYAIVGAPQANHNGKNDAGSAYIFNKDNGGADNWGEIKKIVASDAAVSDNFGESVSISGDYAIVGANKDSENGDYSGSAYIFKKANGGVDNWGEIKKIIASDGAEDDEFGESVSISGDYAIVGAGFNHNNGKETGSAYIFKKDNGGADNWGEIKKIIASDGAEGDYFGRSLSISGNYAIVGAWRNDDNGNYSGSAYIFKKDNGGVDNWGQTKKIIASDNLSGDRFGYSVSILGGYAIIGATGTNTYNGGVYIFKNNTINTQTAALNTVEKIGITLYPNPTKDLVKLAIKNVTEPQVQVNLINMYGKVLNSYLLDTRDVQIDLQAYPSGVYFIRVQAADEIITLKIVKVTSSK